MENPEVNFLANPKYVIVYSKTKPMCGEQRRKVEERDKVGIWDWCVHVTIFQIDS